MKKLNNKKGFTIVELVIVIAVIGILAGVLIPTFSGIQQSAKESAAFQECKNVLSSVLALNEGALPSKTLFVVDTDGKAERLEYEFVYEDQVLGNKASDYNNDNLKQADDGYIVYVSAEAMSSFLDANGVVKTEITSASLSSTELGMIKTVLSIDASKTATYGKDSKGNVVATIDSTTKVTLHYTSDIKSSIVVFLANPQTTNNGGSAGEGGGN